MKLFTKIVIVLSVVAIISVSVEVFFVYTFTKSALQNDIEQEQSELGKQVMDKIDRLLFNYYLGIENIGEEEHIERTLGGELKDARVMERRIKELPFLTGPWDIIQVMNYRGEVVISNTQHEIAGTLEKDPDELKAFNEAINGRIYYSDFIISKETSKPTIIFAAPIRDQEKPNSPIVGVVLGQVAWPVINQILETFEPVNHVELYTHEGILIATNQENSKELFIKNNDIAKKIKDLESVNLTTNTGEELETDSGFKAIVTTVLSRGYLGYKGDKWALFIETPTNIAFAPASKNGFQAGIILVPIILSSILVLFLFISRSLINPIILLTQFTRTISGGDLSKKISIRSKDEIGELGSSFNDMISRLEKYQGDLEEEHSRFMSSVNSLQLGFIAVDVSGNLIAINPAVLKILDLQNEGISFNTIADKIGKNFDLRYHYKHCILEKTHLDVKDVEFGPRFLRIFLAPINLTTTGEIIGAVILIEDITEQKILDRSKDEFFSIASHELRTPLTAIRGNASMLTDLYKSREGDQDAKEMVDDMLSASERLIRIVGDFLDVSRLEQSRAVFKRESINIAEVIKEVLKEINGNASKKNIELKFSSPEIAVSLVMADKDRVKQVIVNLISNAINYTKQGSIVITIENKDKFVKIYVKDTGVGIAIKNQSLLFHKFQQAGDSNLIRDVTQGTGLGLYISKLLVEAMGGTIQLEESTVDKGTIFSFTLPMIK